MVMGIKRMKAGIIITGTGPILILTNLDSIEDPKLAGRLYLKGIKKFIAYELPIEKVQERYGNHFKATMRDWRQSDDLRIVDADGHHVFDRFRLSDLAAPIVYENV